jgi:exodeoxyribonuclease III
MRLRQFLLRQPLTVSVSIATWNVNSVKARLAHLIDWLKADKPDIALLQELKCVDDAFPAMELEELGYNIAIYGEKTYNGVAILSKFPLSDVTRGIPGYADERARYIEAVAALPGSAMRVASVYVPNGQTADSEKFPYKLTFLDQLKRHVQKLLSYQEILVIGGDYNIAPEDIDVHNPKEWHGSVLTHDEVRKSWRRITNLGVYDAWRMLHPKEGGYSWWDYRANAFASDDGLRIDHLLLSPQAADRLESCTVKRELRALEKASDHTPVLAFFRN